MLGRGSRRGRSPGEVDLSDGESLGSLVEAERSVEREGCLVLLGGVERLFGPIAGAAAFTWLHDKVARIDFWQLILGGIFILLVVAFPRGIAGSIYNRWGRYFED